MPTKTQELAKEKILEILDTAWLNLPNLDLKGELPLSEGIFETEDDSMPTNLLRILQDPHYFYFTCKEILGVELLPYQAVVLKQMWKYKFPMLILSRGGFN